MYRQTREAFGAWTELNPSLVDFEEFLTISGEASIGTLSLK